MKRKLFVAALCVLVVLILIVVSGPLLARLGLLKTVFYIQNDESGHIRIVRATVEPTPFPALEPGVALPIVTDARPVIIDTDMAPDDWMAILILLQRSDVNVRAITVTGAGEAHCGPGVRNARDLALLAGRPEIPVACGRETSLEGGHAFPTAWRESVDNLLGLALPHNPDPSASLGAGSLAAESAVDLLIRTVRESPRKVHLIALGPLTNMAEALAADPAFVDNLQMMTIMGGAVNVPGNVNLALDNGNEWAEWNMYADPHAAALVVASGAPITLVPLDATRYAPATMDFYHRLGQDRATPAAEFIYRVLTRQESDLQAGWYYFWDALAAAIVADENLATFQEMSLAVIDEEGPQSGRTAVSDDGYQVRVATSADRARFEALFLDALNGRAP